MDLGIKGRRAIVTGGSSGIGFATTRQFIEEGVRVLITARNEAKLAKAREEEARKIAAKKNSLGRMGKPEELANATVFPCSERASYITGVSLNLDGGRLKGLW